MDYLLHIGIMCVIYAVLGCSLDLVVGQSGLLSMAQAAFYGLGAYSSALLATFLGAPFIVGILVGMAIAAIVSFVVSVPSLRLSDDYFVIATFGFQTIIFSVFNNWMSVTRGPLGIPGIPQPDIFGWHVTAPWEVLVLSTVLASVAYFAVYRITSSPFGRVLHAIREQELGAQSVGKNTLWFKVIAFAVSAVLASLAGSLYAHYVTYIDPSSFTVSESILVVSIVIIGGAGSLWGPLFGAIVVVALPEVLRFVGLPDAVAANLRQILYGSLLVIVVVFRPRGLVGKYDFSR